VHVGASYWVVPALEGFVGAGFETSAVPATTMAPDVPDADKVLLAAGARFMLTDSLFVSASYTHIQYFSRDVSTAASTLATSASGVPYVYPTVEENGGGQYSQWLGLFTGSVEAMF
jgi:long-subunit fatty acid transport protein